MSKPRNLSFKLYTDGQTIKLLKAISGLKDSSVNALVNEAIETWLNLPEQQKLIQRHNLDKIEDFEDSDT